MVTTATTSATTAHDAEVVNGFERRRRRTRGAIVDAAVDLFQTQGVRDTSVEQICDRAEVSVRTFFNHFETRAHLHDAIAEERAQNVAAALDRLTGDERPLPDRLTAFLSAMADYLAERPAYRDFVGEMLQRHPARGDATVRGGALSIAAHRFLAEAADRGEVRTDLPVASLADVVVGAVVVLVANWSADPAFGVRAEATATATVLAALCTGRPASPGSPDRPARPRPTRRTGARR